MATQIAQGDSKLHTLRDWRTGAVDGYLNLETGAVFEDQDGKRRIRQLEETEFVMSGKPGEPLRDEYGRMVHVSALANAAAEQMYRKMTALCGRAPRIPVLDEAGRLMRDATGKLVTMDLGIADVHEPATLPNVAWGYKLAEGIADAVSPVLFVAKQQGYYYTANSDNDFKRKLPMGGAAGAGGAEISPAYSPSLYATKQYTLGGWIPTEVQANADAPLRPMQKLTQMIVDAHGLERDIRVATQLQAGGNWNSNLVQTLLAGSQWNGGANADPIGNIKAAIHASYMPVTAAACSEAAFDALVQAAALQKYIQYKPGIDPLPSPEEFSDKLRLPKLFVSTQKYAVGGAAQYVWGNHFVLLRQPPELPPTTQMDIATAITYRWTGGLAPDGTMTGGLLVRSYYDPKRGGRGGNVIVAIMEDVELMPSQLVGGLILNVLQ